MSDLISGKEAKLAWANGDEVQAQYQGVGKWATLISSSKFCISNFENPLFAFRLKPQTITINGIEVPAPFEPKDGDDFYYLDTYTKRGYALCNNSHSSSRRFAAWRTEEEIKQVVEALRQVFKG